MYLRTIGLKVPRPQRLTTTRRNTANTPGNLHIHPGKPREARTLIWGGGAHGTASLRPKMKNEQAQPNQTKPNHTHTTTFVSVQVGETAKQRGVRQLVPHTAKNLIRAFITLRLGRLHASSVTSEAEATRQSSRLCFPPGKTSRASRWRFPLVKSWAGHVKTSDHRLSASTLHAAEGGAEKIAMV